MELLMRLPEAGPSTRLFRSILDSHWLSTTSRMTRQTQDPAGLVLTAEQEQGGFSEGKVHFRVVALSVTSGLTLLRILYRRRRKALGTAPPRVRCVAPATRTRT